MTTKDCDRRGFIGGILGSIAGLLGRHAANRAASPVAAVSGSAMIRATTKPLIPSGKYFTDEGMAQIAGAGRLVWSNQVVGELQHFPDADPTLTHTVSTADVVT